MYTSSILEISILVSVWLLVLWPYACQLMSVEIGQVNTSMPYIAKKKGNKKTTWIAVQIHHYAIPDINNY